MVYASVFGAAIHRVAGFVFGWTLIEGGITIERHDADAPSIASESVMLPCVEDENIDV